MQAVNTSPEELLLENQFCFPLYACAKEVVRQYRKPLEALNLTYTQYLVMMVLWEHEKLNVKELGEKLYLDSGTLTPVLKSLEAKGFLRRYRSEEDERVLNVELTDAGWNLRDAALDVPGKVNSGIKLNAGEVVQLYELLYKVLGGLNEEE